MRAKGIHWDSQPLGQVFDSELAERLGVNAKTVSEARRRRGIPARRQFTDWAAAEHILGKLTDREAGKLLGRCETVVRRQRVKRGIPPKNRIDWDAQPLGQVLDRELAKTLGVRRSSVTRQRLNRRIPAYSKRVGESC